MTKVTNLVINLQTGSDSTLFASWSFEEETKQVASSSITVGSIVKIKPGSTYYNGVDVPDWVEAKQWKVKSISGDRVIIHESTDGANAINSPIKASNLTLVNGGGSTTDKLNTLDHYEVTWHYGTGDSVWFSGGGSSNVTEKNATYGMPSNATKVKVSVKPVSKTYKSGGNETPYWTGTAVTAEYLASVSRPEVPSQPTVTVDKYNLTALLDNISDSKADQIEFSVVKETEDFAKGIGTVLTRRASFTCAITPGANYRVCCRAINNVDGTNVYSNWGPYSSEVSCMPSSVTNVRCEGYQNDTTVKVSWDAEATAKSYSIEYTTDELYFDSSSEVSSATSQNNYAIITGIEAGREWFFRVRAVNDHGESGWSKVVSIIIGTKPSAPTTWSLTTKAIVGERLTLYWVHNSEDASKQTSAQIELSVNGRSSIIDITTNQNEDDEEQTYSYSLNTRDYPEGASILWRVRTKGISADYSDWSIQRTIDIYAPPTLALKLSTDSTNGMLQSLPLGVTITAGPNTQTPISYVISITTIESYEAENNIGETVIINAGSEIFSKVYNVSDNPLSVAISAGDVTFGNMQSYKMTVTVSMSSGLTASTSKVFTTFWDDTAHEPDASITIDKNRLCAYISPFCVDSAGDLVEEVTLAVYRRESDGSFTELISGLMNDGVISITDPHPALDYARYRVVAQNGNTGSVGYVDLPGIPVSEPSIVIQWDEKWSEFDHYGEDEPEIAPWTGSMIRLPYNIDITEDHDPDVSLVKYIGRQHPVGYYGTQRGHSATWSTDIEKSDKETIYALRRLSAYAGDVYVREPSGTGYWAQITVSMNIKHRSLTIPVTFNIKRVEGTNDD